MKTRGRKRTEAEKERDGCVTMSAGAALTGMIDGCWRTVNIGSRFSRGSVGLWFIVSVGLVC